MINLSIILIGFTAMASQIIYLRELLVVFYGNELSISFILASWLIGGSIGSAFFGRFADLPSLRGPNGRSNQILVFSLCQIALGLLLPSGIVAIRLIKYALHVNPGEIIPIFPLILASFIILAPLCIILGFMFSLGCRIYRSQAGVGNGIGNVYILEAVGSVVGGALTSFLLIQIFDPVQITGIFAVLNMLAAFLLIFVNRREDIETSHGAASVIARLPKATEAISLVLLTIIIAMWPLGGWSRVREYSLKKQWQGYELLASRNSIYGNVALVKRGEDYSLFDNGLHLYTIPDKPTSEEAVHLALLEHPNPKKILLVGGGAGGLMEEIIKHPVERVDYVELDPLIIKIAEEYLPESYYTALKDPRVHIENTDGRFFIKRAREKYDCAIIHVGDPYTAEANRYYTAEFFKEVKNILNEGGIMSFGLTSSESYISPPLGKFLSSVYVTVKSVFADCIVLPGETAYFMASDKPGLLTYDYKILEERAKKRSVNAAYVREYYLFSKLSPGKISYVKNIVTKGEGVAANRDLHPVSYYYGLIFWTTLFRDSAFSNILKSVNDNVIWAVLGLFIILSALASLIYRRSFKKAVLIAVMSAGFTTMAFQIIILLAFQILYGYLFYKLGFILTAFMAGLAAGGYLAVKVASKMERDRSFLLAIQGDLILFSLFLPLLFSFSKTDNLFPALSAIAGFIGGFQFPLAGKVLLGGKEDGGRVGGLTYGLDLLGSFFGVLLTGVFLIPILGIPKTCFAIALINLAVLGLLAINLSVEE